MSSRADYTEPPIYGAAAKGNTLLNDASVKPDLLPFVCDAAPALIVVPTRVGVLRVPRSAGVPPAMGKRAGGTPALSGAAGTMIKAAAPSKQGKYLPGSHISIRPPQALREHRPDWVLILPWNIAEEGSEPLSGLVTQGMRFVTAVPELRKRSWGVPYASDA